MSTEIEERSPSPTSTVLSTTTSCITETTSLSLAIDLPSIHFSTVEQFDKAVHEASRKDEDVLYVTGISMPQFEELEAYREKIGGKYRFFHLPHDHLVIVTIPTGKHERVDRTFYNFITTSIAGMGLQLDWMSTGSTRLRGNSVGGASREGDSGGRPFPNRNDGANWPTLVVETGVSQTLIGLHAAIRWWFAESEHAVKIVILIKVNPAMRQIKIEKWTEGVETRFGIATRGRSPLTPFLRQTITINMTPEAAAAPVGHPLYLNPDSFIVDGGTLLLEFELLFLRPPNPPMERDIVVSERLLKQLGMILWDIWVEEGI